MGKKPPNRKVDIKKLAKLFGADSIISSQKVDEQGREYFEFEVIADNGHQTKRIYSISQNDLDTGDYKLLCETEGQFFFHCIFMGRHTEDFHNRLYGYRIENPTRKEMKIRVIFYEKA